PSKKAGCLQQAVGADRYLYLPSCIWLWFMERRATLNYVFNRIVPCCSRAAGSLTRCNHHIASTRRPKDGETKSIGSGTACCGNLRFCELYLELQNKETHTKKNDCMKSQNHQRKRRTFVCCDVVD